MDQYKPKQLKFEDYLSFFQDHHADKLTYSQLNQVCLCLSPFPQSPVFVCVSIVAVFMCFVHKCVQILNWPLPGFPKQILFMHGFVKLNNHTKVRLPVPFLLI